MSNVVLFIVREDYDIIDKSSGILLVVLEEIIYKSLDVYWGVLEPYKHDFRSLLVTGVNDRKSVLISFLY